MKLIRWSALIVILVALGASAQTKIVIPAGTPEDQAIQAITNESDVQKRDTMLEEFVQKFASNPQAVAYGNWQLSQNYLAAGDAAKALSYGDKALAAMPDNLDILVAQVGIAQQLKDNAKVIDYTTRGGAVLLAYQKQTKPEGMSDEDFANRRAGEQAALQQSSDFLEAAAYNVISAEENPKTTLAYAEKFSAAFPASKFKRPVTTLALVSLQKMNDISALAAYADKVLGPTPDDPEMLTVLANAFAEDPKNTQLAKAGAYARKAIELTKDKPDKATAAGYAHSILGYVLLKEEKTPAGIAELKLAVPLLKSDPSDLAVALYRLGFAQAKLKNYAEARATLNEALKIEGPVQPLARDLLEKVNAAGKKQ